MTKRQIAKLDVEIERIYRANHCGVEINIMDIGKVFKAGHAAAAAGTNMADAISAAVALIRKNVLAFAIVAGSATAANAQSEYLVLHPQDIGISRAADIEEGVETDGNPATDEFVLADYSTQPARRAILQVQPSGATCLGPWENWFGDFQYLWPTYITLAGKTRAVWTQPNTGQWIVMTLDTPACQ